MITVELYPTLQFHCNFCDNKSWHDCIVRSGMEALFSIEKFLAQEAIGDDFVKKVQRRLKKMGMVAPDYVNANQAVVIQSSVFCKECHNIAGSVNKGYGFVCDQCGRNNYLLPTKFPEQVICMHCGISAKAVPINFCEEE